MVIELVGWLAVAIMGALALTQSVGWSGLRPVAVVQSLTPYVLAPAAPIAVAAAITGRAALAATAAAITIALVVLAWPLLVRADEPAAVDGAQGVRVGHANLLYLNRRLDELPDVLAQLDADVLTFSEYTPQAAAVLAAAGWAEQYPHRVERPHAGSAGTALWSRMPVQELEPPRTEFETVAVVLDLGRPVQIIVIHPPPPHLHGAWADELAVWAVAARSWSTPTVLVGDLNASWWHPQMRRLIGAGLRDAHQVHGRGFSTSWPTDRGPLPPFVRLDHALVNDGLVVAGVVDVDVPGSDHRGLVVSVLPAR